MHLKSTSGPINVLVLNQDEGVATMVPMPKYPRTSRQQTHARQGEASEAQQDEVGSSCEGVSASFLIAVEEGLRIYAAKGQKLGGQSSSTDSSSLIGAGTSGMGGEKTSVGEGESPSKTGQQSSDKEDQSRSDRDLQGSSMETESASCSPDKKGTTQRSLAAVVARLHKGNEGRNYEDEEPFDAGRK